jgi:3-isopropylmalate dehydrogenase
MQRRKRLTLVDKANVLPSMAFFRRVFDEVAAEFPEVATDRIYVGYGLTLSCAAAGDVRRYGNGNMFSGTLDPRRGSSAGWAALADVGDHYAVFQPSHGSAPTQGQGIANPVAAILSAAMMLEWLGMGEAAAQIQGAVRKVFAGRGVRTRDMGGSVSTREMTDAIISALP